MDKKEIKLIALDLFQAVFPGTPVNKDVYVSLEHLSPLPSTTVLEIMEEIIEKFSPLYSYTTREEWKKEHEQLKKVIYEVAKLYG